MSYATQNPRIRRESEAREARKLAKIEAAAGLLTPADLVVLAVLRERPLHGHELFLILEVSDVKSWIEISRPQVYWSLRKLLKEKLIRPVTWLAKSEPKGPPRTSYAPTGIGMRALNKALRLEWWAQRRPRPPFLTWLALSAHVSFRPKLPQVQLRHQYLRAELDHERATLEEIRRQSQAGRHEGPQEGPVPGLPRLDRPQRDRLMAAELTVELTIRQLEAELEWLKEVRRRLRAPDR
ncbi:MAG: PadR family transcriptional regulator [Gemmatimonadota bacterium]